MRSKFKTVDELPLSLCAEEVAGVLGISRAGAYILIKSKGFPKIKIGGRYVVPRDKFLDWINQNSTSDNNKWAV